MEDAPILCSVQGKSALGMQLVLPRPALQTSLGQWSPLFFRYTPLLGMLIGHGGPGGQCAPIILLRGNAMILPRKPWVQLRTTCASAVYPYHVLGRCLAHLCTAGARPQHPLRF